MANRTKKSSKKKSHQNAKPYPSFPLTLHASGRWCKKIPTSAPQNAGKRVYFGRVEDGWQAALERFEHEWKYITTGRPVPPNDAEQQAGCTVRSLCNAFLNSKRKLLDNGELSPRTFQGYFESAGGLVNQFGDRSVSDLGPADFEPFRTKLAKRLGIGSLKNEINRIRIIFKYAADQRLIDTPVHFGQSFNRPPIRAIRKERQKAGPRMLESEEIRLILDALEGKRVRPCPSDDDKDPKRIQNAPDPVLRAMVLLGCNCGFGNHDIADLPKSALDLNGSWEDFPRPKTGIQRRVPLWPETVVALRKAINSRPHPSDEINAECVFLTSKGNRWVRVRQTEVLASDGRVDLKLTPIDALTQKFSKLLKRLGINGRKRLGFYALRHVFQTIGGDSKDRDAVSSIMGHVDASMAGQYRERISDERLQAVVCTVRNWLWPKR